MTELIHSNSDRRNLYISMQRNLQHNHWQEKSANYNLALLSHPVSQQHFYVHMSMSMSNSMSIHGHGILMILFWIPTGKIIKQPRNLHVFKMVSIRHTYSYIIFDFCYIIFYVFFIGFVTLDVLSLYVSTNYTSCLLRRSVRIRFVMLDILSLYVLSLYILLLHVLS